MVRPVLPAPIQEMWNQLEAAGFTLSREDSHNEIASWFADLTGKGLSVRLVLDRGQWGVRIGDPDRRRWAPPVIWRAYLDGGYGETFDYPLETECEVTAKSIPEIEAAIANDPRVWEHLSDYGAHTLEARLRAARQERTGSAVPPTDTDLDARNWASRLRRRRG